MLAIVCICVCEFQDEILLREEECKTQENLIFYEKVQNSNLLIPYRLKTWNFLDFK